MVATCEGCGLCYDDTYRLTLCPHDGFEMATTVIRADGAQRVCTSIAELWDFLEGHTADATSH